MPQRSRLRSLGAALGLGALLLTGCGLRPGPPVADPSPSPVPTPSPSTDADAWPTVTDESTGLSFQLPYEPQVFDYSGFQGGPRAQQGTTYWLRYESPRTNVSATIQITVYRNVGTEVAGGRAVLSGVAEIRRSQGDRRVDLHNVASVPLRGHTATYATLDFTTKVSHHERYELAQIAGDDWGMIVVIGFDGFYGRISKAEGHALRDLRSEVLAFVDFTPSGTGHGVTT